MQTVSQVNTMADFVRLVSAARSRNSGLVKNSGQPEGARSFQNIMRPGVSHANAKIRMEPANDSAIQTIPVAKQQENKQILGTKFDAYA